MDPSRLRSGELVAGTGGLVLLASMFLLPWFGLPGTLEPTALTLRTVRTSLNGWHSLTSLRWLILLSILAALVLVFVQATNEAPAIPVTMSVVVAILGSLTALALVYRVLIDVPGAGSMIERKAGGFIGLVAAGAIAYGGYLSMRQEGAARKYDQRSIRTVEPSSRTRS